jgi:hypothetical protein
MPRTSRSGGRGGLRTVALAVAVLVALASTAAVVISDDPQILRLAVVGALWAFVLAAFAAPRRRSEDDGDRPGTEVELRRTYEIELEREVAARREYELQLEVYLRRELERGLAEDVAALRDEVGRMRGEMMDRLDGELRMERIETTRLVGGSLRALQDEARRLGIDVPVPAELTGGSIFDEPVPAAGPAPSYEYGGSSAAAYSPYPSYADPPPYAPPAPERPYPPQYSPAYAPPAPGYAPPTSASPAPGYASAPSAPAYASAAPLAAPSAPAAAGPSGYGEPPAPRDPPAGESVPRRRRAREDGEDNEVMSRLLGR